jgi:methylglyoxal reductase
MEKRALGQSGLEVTAIGLGCWVMGGWMWGGAEDDESIAAIRTAVESGVNFIDTAPIYGKGHSEEVVGKAIEGLRDEIVLATKCGLTWPPRTGRPHFVDEDGDDICHNLEADSIIKECEDSLRRLNTDVIDVYQCHWPDPGVSIEETMSALVTLKEQGKIRSIGVSNFSVDQMTECLKCAPLNSDQPQYNMLDRSIEAGVLPFCRDNNIGVIAYGPLGRGILTGKVTMDRTFEKNDHRAKTKWYQPENRRRVLDFLDKIRPIADGHNATLAQLAANWVISQPGVTTAICGARRPEQVKENVRAAEFKLTDEEQATIRSLLDELE